MNDALILISLLGAMSGVLALLGVAEKIVVHFMDKE